ncbi:cytochrome P450 [Gautieria morchelliformis]|nr:cytochrome P450 [Gautieria morchelliformis]
MEAVTLSVLVAATLTLFVFVKNEVTGDIVYFNVLGKSIVSINSYKVANDLLDKKGAIYSDRPRLPMIKELRIFYSQANCAAEFQAHVVATSYRPVMLREVKVLLQNLLTTPNSFVVHLKSMAGAIIMMVTYGHQIAPENDEFVKLAEDVHENASEAHGSSLVDMLPILKYVPAWLPGASFKRKAIFARQLSIKMRNAPFEMVQGHLAAGTARPLMTSSLLEDRFNTDGLDAEDIIKNCGGVVYSAGADTTVTALTNFFLAMMTYPHVQGRAQKELDLVIGRDRIPQFEDRFELPYLSALIMETLRWKAVSPLGIPHCTTENDEYRNTFIPKATVVIANIS